MSTPSRERTPNDIAANAFLADLVKLYAKHGLALAHEDEHGGFIIRPLDIDLVNWVLDASVEDSETGE